MNTESFLEPNDNSKKFRDFFKNIERLPPIIERMVVRGYKTKNMKKGIELIAQERDEQILKHKRTTESDKLFNQDYQLCTAAGRLLFSPKDESIELMKEPIFRPQGWDEQIWNKMLDKPYKERLIISGALIAAELDRLQSLEK